MRNSQLDLGAQFIIAREAPEAPTDWTRRRIESWHLCHSPQLPARELTLEGVPGLMLGWTIGDASSAGGRWLHIGGGRVTADPLGALSLVYHQAGVLASSPVVLPAELRQENVPLTTVLNLPAEDRWYPFGLTPYRAVRRLLPGHTLRLATMQIERCDRTTPSRMSDQSAAEVVAFNLGRQFEAILQVSPVMMGLTAGSESRMLLAALKGVHDTIDTFTIGAPTAQDVITGRLLARRFGLRHAVLAPVRNPAEEAAWFERTGRAVAGAAMRNAALKGQLRSDAILIKGMGGEIGRAFYYRPDDTPGMEVTPDLILQRLGMPPTPELRAEAAEWLERTPAEDAFALLDLLYLENRVGCWAAPQIYGDLGPVTTLWPLNHPDTVAAMRSLSVEAKRSNRLWRLVAEQLWPELVSIPVNEAVGFRRWMARMRAYGRDAASVLRRVSSAGTVAEHGTLSRSPGSEPTSEPRAASGGASLET